MPNPMLKLGSTGAAVARAKRLVNQELGKNANTTPVFGPFSRSLSVCSASWCPASMPSSNVAPQRSHSKSPVAWLISVWLSSASRAASRSPSRIVCTASAISSLSARQCVPISAIRGSARMSASSVVAKTSPVSSETQTVPGPAGFGSTMNSAARQSASATSSVTVTVTSSWWIRVWIGSWQNSPAGWVV